MKQLHPSSQSLKKAFLTFPASPEWERLQAASLTRATATIFCAVSITPERDVKPRSLLRKYSSARVFEYWWINNCHKLINFQGFRKLLVSSMSCLMVTLATQIYFIFLLKIFLPAWGWMHLPFVTAQFKSLPHTQSYLDPCLLTRSTHNSVQSHHFMLVASAT